MAIEQFSNNPSEFQDFEAEIDNINFNRLYIEAFGADRIEELKSRLQSEIDPIERASYLFEIDLISGYLTDGEAA